MITVGKIHFWIFPNLDDEKSDFFGSFRPFYSVEVSSKSTKKTKKKKAGVEVKNEMSSKSVEAVDEANQLSVLDEGHKDDPEHNTEITNT